MGVWQPGDRVEHRTFGNGTVLQSDGQHTVVHFDDHGRRKFATALVVLTEGRQREVSRSHQKATSERITDSGGNVPSTVEHLMDLARRTVGNEDSLNEFVATLRKALPGPSHQYVGVLSGMRVQQFQNWLYDVNPQWQLTDAQLLAVLRVEFPLAGAELFTGDVDAGLRHIRSMRADYNRDGHNGPSPISRGLPLSVGYGTF